MDNKNWATETLKEAPYWREGMSVEEYEKERNYFHQHIAEWTNGKYIPLWKQNKID